MKHRPAGFTIIEFMIAITLSLLVLAALSGTFVANSRARTEIERANEQIENGRYALQLLGDDLELAGFYSHFNLNNAAGDLTWPASKPDPCSASLASIQANFMLHIQGYDNVTSLSAVPACATLLGDYKPYTDIVVVRRVATCVSGAANCPAVANAAYFQASLCSSGTELGALTPTSWYRLDSNTANLNRTRRDCATRADYRQFMTNIYFVANNDQAGDGVPTLKRLELGASGGSPAFSVVPLAHGIRNLQVEYGIDTSGDGAPEGFTPNPDTYGGAVIDNWRNVTAVRLNVLSQNGAPTRDYVDTKIYTLGLNAAGGTQCAHDTNGDGTGTCNAFSDGYKKHVYQSTVRLNNPAGRREAP